MILLEKYSQLVDKMDVLNGKAEFEIEPWTHEKLETKIQFIIFVKNELIESLQTFVIDELEK